MKTLAGNTLLVIDNDHPYVLDLKKVLESKGAIAFGVTSITQAKPILKSREIEYVICNYYVSDGLILQLIDWARKELGTLPVFISLGVPTIGDMGIHHRQLIAGTWDKHSSIEDLIGVIAKHAFDEQEFKDRILSLVENRGIQIEIIIDGKRNLVKPLEINDTGIFISTDEEIRLNDFAVLRLSLFEGKSYINFSVLGSFKEVSPSGLMFCVFHGYQQNWNKILRMLEDRQIKTTNFLKKVAGY